MDYVHKHPHRQVQEFVCREVKPMLNGKATTGSREEKTQTKESELRPLTVKEMSLWAAAKPAFELRLSSLPPKLAKLRWFDAICALESDPACTPTQRMVKTRVLQVVAEAYHLPQLDGYYPVMSLNGGIVILPNTAPGYPYFPGKVIQPEEMDELRRELCELNGYTLPDESEDPALAAAAECGKKHGGKTLKLRNNINDLCAAMALQAGCEPAAVPDWPMKHFNAMAGAVTRMEQYRTYGMLEATGLFHFKAGNPVPSWLLDRVLDLPDGIAPVSELNQSAKGLL